jgi:coenzyme Q-binding protein COQ10
VFVFVSALFNVAKMKSGAQVLRHSELRVVPFARESFFRVIADVEDYQQFLPWCTRSRVLERFGPNKFDAELNVGFRGLYHVRMCYVFVSLI